jgi:alcohol dehydrogenase
MALTRFGGYATAVNIDTRYLIKAPDGWTAIEAAAYPVQALTAWYGLVRLGEVERGDLVLVHSAAGGVGLHALTLLRELGAGVVATVGRPAKRDFLVHERGLPADAVIVREPRRFGAQLDRALAACSASGFDVVFDAIAGRWLRPAYERLRPEGRLVIYGAADFMTHSSRPGYLTLAAKYLRRPRLDPIWMISDNRSVMGFNLLWLWDQVDRLPGAAAAALALIRTRPHVGEVLAFADALRAMRVLQGGETTGKVVLTV